MTCVFLADGKSSAAQSVLKRAANGMPGKKDVITDEASEDGEEDDGTAVVYDSAQEDGEVGAEDEDEMEVELEDEDEEEYEEE